MTVREVLDAYMRHAAAVNLHSLESRRNREQAFRLFCDVLGDAPADDIKAYHLTDFVENHSSWRSASTRRSRALYFKAAFEWAAKQERISRNPFAKVRYQEAERRPEMPDPVFIYLASESNKPFERACRFLRMTWCRLSELCRAQWEDVNLDAAVWTIVKHKSRKYQGKPKVVCLVPEAVNLLRELRSLQDDPPTGTIFLNTRGRPWSKDSLGSYLRNFKRRHGLKEVATLHGLRHRGASAAIGNGASIKLVAEQLGHSSVTITERWYYHPSSQSFASIRAATGLGMPVPKRATKGGVA